MGDRAWFVRLYGKTIHEFWLVVYRSYRRTNHPLPHSYHDTLNVTEYHMLKIWDLGNMIQAENRAWFIHTGHGVSHAKDLGKRGICYKWEVEHGLTMKADEPCSIALVG